MDDISATGSHVAVFVPPLGGGPVMVLEDCAHYELYDTATGAMVGVLPCSSKWVCIQWPHVITVKNSGAEVWKYDGRGSFNYLNQIAALGIQRIANAAFVADDLFVLGWNCNDNSAWGLFRVPPGPEMGNCAMLRSGTVHLPGARLKACSSEHVLVANEMKEVYINMFTMQQTATIKRQARLALAATSPIPWKVEFSNGEAELRARPENNCTFRKSGMTYTQGNMRRSSRACLIIEPTVGRKAHILAPGVSVTPDMKFYVIRKTNANGHDVAFEKRPSPTFEGCGGDKTAHTKLLQNYIYCRQRLQLHNILSPILPTGIIDDIFTYF